MRLAIALMREARKQQMLPAVEVHRGTATETPEKTYAIADRYQKITGELLPMTWDFSHLAIIKHLTPENYADRLLIRPDLIRTAQQFHFRPFNGHHCQVPATDGNARVTPELKQWLPFLAKVLTMWKTAPHNAGRELFATPEFGPARPEGDGYGLSCFPPSWDDTCVLRRLIDRAWNSKSGHVAGSGVVSR